ncbi:uncharacterized protein BP5553_03446 [Venustampulla echinocandica]|uniref:Uncharacterized protein n=1 Tax=Venustampulla echinocandica TaxID=2656787 RepID=A0A370TUB0_9HELO|nr:uncharacterized protein BP5553_03446 [Venustampulla echinocandica]RDL39106.1 hypothetical protein BP5553_03446 [Venustampulla echinocandica]
MKFSATLAIVGLSAVACALPAELMPREDCYPGTMEKGKPYHCGNPKFKVNKDGHCSKPIADFHAPEHSCLGFCEDTISAEYGPEQPFRGGACQNGTTCSVAEGDSVTITNSFTVSASVSLGRRDADGNEVEEEVILERGQGLVEDGLVKRDAAPPASSFKAGFDFGASYTWSKSIGYTLTNTKSKTLDEKTCGYWTFIPYVMKVCGTMSRTKLFTPQGGYMTTTGKPICEARDYKDDKKYCNKVPYKGSNGRADGVIVFVYVDCKSGKVKKDGQDAAYKWPGVAANDDTVKSAADILACLIPSNWAKCKKQSRF